MSESEFFGPGAVLHHVGLAVRSIAAVRPDAEIVRDPSQGVALAFVHIGDARVELLEPLGEDSPIAQSLRQNTKLLHLCFEVPDLDAALACGRRAGFHRLTAPRPVAPLGGRRIAWVYSQDYGLMELLEKDNGPGQR